LFFFDFLVNPNEHMKKTGRSELTTQGVISYTVNSVMAKIIRSRVWFY